jgi:hypothetical protein
VIYDLKTLAPVQVGGAGSSIFVLDFVAAGRNPFLGLPGSDVDGDLATLPAPFVTGGVLELYEDYSKDYTPDPGGVGTYDSKLPSAVGSPPLVPFTSDGPPPSVAGVGAAGDAAPLWWVEGAAGHLPGPAGADTFVNLTDGTYFLASTLVDLNYVASIGVSLPPTALLASVPLTPGVVLREVVDFASGTGSGFAFANVVGGAWEGNVTRSGSGPLLDLSLQFNINTVIENLFAAGPPLQTWLSDPGTIYAGPGQWTIDSNDPVSFAVTPVPEPGTLSLLGLSLLGLVGLRKKRS